MDQNSCQYCSTTFKNSSNLKTHLTGSKKCLKLRGLKIESKHTCKGCYSVFMTKINLSVHQESCKEHNTLYYREENDRYKEENKELHKQTNSLQEKLDKSDHIIFDLQQKLIHLTMIII